MASTFRLRRFNRWSGFRSRSSPHPSPATAQGANVALNQSHWGVRVVKLKSKSANRGFTLLELLILVAVMAILLSVAVPSFFSAIQNSRMTAQANDLVTAFQLARSEALKRNVPISICASDTSAATPTCGSDWSEGWLVIIDASAVGSGSASYASYADDVLRVWPALTGDAAISGANAPDFIRYLPNGQIDLDASDPAPEFEMRIPKCTGDKQRNIEISRTGRASAERVECS